MEKITKTREICKLYKSFGYDDFYYVPLGEHIDNSNGRVMLYVGIRCKHMLRDLVEAVNYIGTRKFPDSFLFVRKSRVIKITPKPLLVLEELASDLTLIQVAEKLGISIHTADKHSAAAKKALNANTIHGAIYKARKLGLIPDDGRKKSFSTGQILPFDPERSYRY